MARKNTKWCDESTLSKDLSGKVYVVTGANSGVGFETTQQLVKQGAHVVMACRRVEAGEAAAKTFQDPKGSYEVIRCDLADLQSVRDFASSFLSKRDRLNGLMCNAGAVIMGDEAKYTSDGFEMTMAASFFGHFLLTELLLDVVRSSTPSRIGILSSVVHANRPGKRYDINFADLNWKTRKYSAFDAYGEAKLANVLYALELGERLKDTGVTPASIHPGWARSNFGRGNGFFMDMLFTITSPFTRSMSDSNWASAQTSLHVLLSDDAAHHPGAYFSQSSVLYRDKECRDGGWPMKSPNPNANDINKAKRLVETARKLVGLDA